MTKKTPLLSIIIAAHKEGLIAHKTLLSVKRALEDVSFDYEVIATLDNPDETTKNYFSSQTVLSELAVHKIDVKDLAAARNYGVSVAKGAYIATLDADDLVSQNWFQQGVEYVRSQEKDVVAHTHYSVNFGTQDIVWEKFDSRSKDEDALIMTEANRWDSAIITKKSVLEKFPYQPNKDGYGSEDWHFNSNTLAANIPHVVVPQTILFVRRKDVSEMTIQASDRRTVHYTDLLDFKSVANIDITPFYQRDTPEPQRLSLDITPLVKKGARLSYRSFEKIPGFAPYAQKLKRKLISLKSSNETPQRFPAWLMQEWRDIHGIDKEIFPSKELIETVPLYHSEMYELGLFYHHLAKCVRQNPDYIIFVPYLTKGGADLVAINYANTIKKLHPSWHVAVVATENQPSIWADRLDESVDFVPFGEIAGGLPRDLKLQILARFVVQSQAKKLHIIQSPLAFDFVAAYKTLLDKNGYTIYACAFCEDKDKQGRIAGHVHSGIPKAYSSLSHIFTDNTAISQQLVDEYGFDKEKFTTHYQPVKTRQQWKPHNNAPFKILWAGRIAKQKRPDILLEIARKLDASQYHIDMYGVFEEDYTPEEFNNIPTLTYKGQFNGLLSLPIHEYDLYLYTSENDGMPNALLEVASTGTPIVAPDVGGVGEVVLASTGALIANHTDSDAYVSTITSLKEDPKKLRKVADTTYELVAKRHDRSQFEASIRKDV